MIERQTSSEYVCEKDKTHAVISMAGQKMKCWLCGSKMKEIGKTAIITKGRK